MIKASMSAQAIADAVRLGERYSEVVAELEGDPEVRAARNAAAEERVAAMLSEDRKPSSLHLSLPQIDERGFKASIDDLTLRVRALESLAIKVMGLAAMAVLISMFALVWSAAP